MVIVLVLKLNETEREKILWAASKLKSKAIWGVDIET